MLVLLAAAIPLGWMLWRLIQMKFCAATLDNIPGPSPRSFWTGNFLALFDPKGWSFHEQIVQRYGGVVRIDGPMKSTILYVSDPVALYHIIVKDQPIYSRDSGSLLVSRIMFGEGLLSIGSGEQHHKQRKILNPVFNVVHLRRLAPVLHGVAHRLRAGLSSNVTKSRAEVDMLHWLTRCSIELFGQGGLGYSFDSLTDEAVHPYSAAIREVQPLLLRLSLAIRFILPWASKIGTPRFQRAVVDRVPWKALHEFQDVLDMLDSTTRKIYQEKRTALSSATGEEHGKDIISILMQDNMGAGDDDCLTEAEVLGQMTTLIFAAAETTSTALARIFYLLAENADAQDRLRVELAEAQRQNGGADIPYDALTQLPFLDAVCRETLRLYPPVPIFLRTSLADAVLPLSTPLRGRDGTELDALPIPRGTTLMLSLHAANRARSIWGVDATVWKPTRWLAGSLPESVTKSPATGVYQHLLTFSGGPRACIGFKLAQLEIKVVLAALLPAFRFSVGKQEIDWNFGFIVRPSVQGVQGMQLPLVLERV